jgi:hypothetical protein
MFTTINYLVQSTNKWLILLFMGPAAVSNKVIYARKRHKCAAISQQQQKQ